jgi:hypothetical protein
MKKFYFCAFLLAFQQFSSQATPTIWQKNLHSEAQDLLSGMTATIDRQILLTGSSIQAQTTLTVNKTNNGYDYHVIKMAQNGAVLWDKYFGGNQHDYLVSAVATLDGGFFLTGTSFSGQSGDKKVNNLGGSDIWMLRLNENGEELWQKTVGTTSNDEAAMAVETADGGFFVTGSINSNTDLFGSKDVFISRLDKNGKLVNTTVLGGSALDEVQEMAATPDGGSLLVVYSNSASNADKYISGSEENTSASAKGISRKSENLSEDLFASLRSQNSHLQDKPNHSRIFGKTTENFGHGDFWVVKLDPNAKIKWQKSFGGTEDDRPKTIDFTNTGYLIGGETRSSASGNKKENIEEGTDLWLIAVDKDGNELWQKTYNFGNRDVLMSANVIRKTNRENFSEDQGFLLGGYTQAENKIEKDDEKFWMLYVNTEGKEQWRKYVEGKSKKKEERLFDAKLQSDGTFLLAGTSAEELGQENWKILKLGDKDLDNLVEKQDIKIYPNPTTDYCYVEIGFEFTGEAQILLHDMSGRQIQSFSTKQKINKINTANMPQGIYVVTIKADSKTANSKIIKR